MSKRALGLGFAAALSALAFALPALAQPYYQQPTPADPPWYHPRPQPFYQPSVGYYGGSSCESMRHDLLWVLINCGYWGTYYHPDYTPGHPPRNVQPSPYVIAPD